MVRFVQRSNMQGQGRWFPINVGRRGYAPVPSDPRGTTRVGRLDHGAGGVSLAPAGAAAQSGPGFPVYGPDQWLGSVNEFTRPLFTQYFNQVTPENAGKWGSAAGTTRTAAMRWTQLDQAYAFAQTNGFPFNFHVLVWGNQQPTWMAALPAEEQLIEIKKWFAAVAERYPNIEWLQVVNEPLHDPPDCTPPFNQGTAIATPAATTRGRSAGPTAPTARAGTGSSTRSAWRSSTSRTRS